jgi:glycosyltransferase involved in cell wall biosynthesis
LKLKRKSIKWFAYDLDPFSFNKLLSNYYLGFLFRLFREILVYVYADKILLTHELYRSYKKSIFFFFIRKLNDIGIPMLKVKKLCNTNNNSINKHKVYALYIGKFYSNYRNPNYMIKSFIEIMKTDGNLFLYIVGSESSDYLNQFNINEIKRIKLLPRVSRRSISNFIKNSMVLINVGNLTTNQLPSKVLEYIGYGKPIINFYSLKKDTSKFYLSHYTNSIQINQNLNFHQNLIRINGFLTESRTKQSSKVLYNLSLPEQLIDYKLDKVAERLINSLSSL